MNTTETRDTFNWEVIAWAIVAWSTFVIFKIALSFSVPMSVYWDIVKEYWEFRMYVVLRYMHGTWR